MNNCGWKITEPITAGNKLHFLQHLIFNEVITQRERNLKAFFSGMNNLGIGTLVQTYPLLTKTLFVAESKPITIEEFKSLIVSERPDDSLNEKAYSYFMDFLYFLDGVLQFASKF